MHFVYYLYRRKLSATPSTQVAGNSNKPSSTNHKQPTQRRILIAKIITYPATGQIDLKKQTEVHANTRNNRVFYYCHSHEVATGQYECPYADLIDNTICCEAVCKYNMLGRELGNTEDPYVKVENEFGLETYLPQSYFNDVLDMKEEDFPF